MLDDIGDVHLFAFYSRLGQRLVEQFSRRSDERMTLKVFAIARLFTYQHYFRAGRAFSKNRLSCAAPNIATLT